MKKNFLILIIAILIGLVAFTQRFAILTVALEKGMAKRIGTNHLEMLEDGLHLALCGAGGPLPAPNASGPCVAVVAGDRLYIVDAGTDGVRNFGRMGYPAGNIQAVLLTHFHSDHIDVLGEMGTLRWAAGDNANPLPVYGPTGVEQVVEGFNLAYAQDFQYRHAHHGDAVAPLAGAGLEARAFAPPERGAVGEVLNEDGLIVEAISADHDPVKPAVSYRFTYKGRSMVISGDTVKSQTLEDFSRNVDLLVHEALAPNLVAMMHTAAIKAGNPILEKITRDIPDYHASPTDAAEIAKAANVGHLLYYHIVPSLVLPGQASLFLNGAEDVFSAYTLGEDGVAFSLPAASNEIIKTSRGL